MTYETARQRIIARERERRVREQACPPEELPAPPEPDPMIASIEQPEQEDR